MRRFAILCGSFVLAVSLFGRSQDVPVQATDSAASSEGNSTPPVSPLPSSKPVKSYHDGSLRDIDAIGNRKVGCDRGLTNWYSLEKQIEMGRSYAAQVESTTKLISDPVIGEYINRIGQNLVRNSDA